MRYELIQLAQLVFALSLMFGAFLGGIAIGWWRWGRRAELSSRAVNRQTPEPSVSSASVFTPDERDDAQIVLGHPIFDTGANDTPAQLVSPMFAESPQISERSEASTSQ